MNKYRFISLKAILDRVMDDVVMMDLNVDSATREAVDCINLIANPAFLEREDIYLYVKDYRTELPENLVNIVQTNRILDGGKRGSLHSSANPFYKAYNKLELSSNNIGSNSYKIQGDYLYTNFEIGKLHLSYDSIPLDTEGNIMIPDDTSVVKAVEYYIKSFHYHNKWMLDVISENKYRSIEVNKNHYMGKAQSAKLLEGIDTISSLSNILTRFLPQQDHTENNFEFLNEKERLRTYR